MNACRRHIASAAIAFGVSIGAIGPNAAQAQVLNLEDIVEVRLLEGWRRDDGRHMTAIQIRLAPGWKTYWRAPGEGGIPPRLSLNTGAQATLHWPRPEVFFDNGMRSIGYRGEVIWPLELDLGAGQHAVAGQIELGVCEDVCMPVTLDLEAVLPNAGGPDPAIVAALSDGVHNGADIGAGIPLCRLTPTQDGLRLQASMDVPAVGNDETVVVEIADAALWVSPTQSTRDGAQVVAVAEILPMGDGPIVLDRSDLRITVIGSQMAVELEGCAR
ncbi:MAG: protein-disulfide reductase DsbD domain-containing protein [Pseudomonadota bacterium]